MVFKWQTYPIFINSWRDDGNGGHLFAHHPRAVVIIPRDVHGYQHWISRELK
jgi:hypothetical protein